MRNSRGSLGAIPRCGQCGHFASVHHGGGGGRPASSSCAATDCGCPTFVADTDTGVPSGTDNLTPADVAQLVGLSVHTLSYWRQTGQGPKTIKAGARTLYRRTDLEQWLAEVDGRSNPISGRNVQRASTSTAARWYEKAVQAAGQIEPAHTSPWKQASTYALISIAASLLTRTQPRPPHADPTEPGGHTGELLTVAEVATMTRLSAGTLRYWRHAGSGGPPSIKLGRRVMYRRTDVEKWLQQAQ